jgi:hypothetical protein
MSLKRRLARRWRVAVVAVALVVLSPAPVRVQEAGNPETAILFLSGHGPEDALNWEFLCTAGRHSRVWTTIPVPSCWETQGFGTYNYGNEINADNEPVGGEQGLYRRTFTVPAEWRGRRVRIVFDGAMTDTTVWVNGEQAGPTHQGAFYRFHYDITPLVKFGETNLLEATVAKTSSNRSINNAERAADYWVFGGIFRPVWLEARPAPAIERTAIDARADGRLSIDVYLAGQATGARVTAQLLDASGEAVGSPFQSDVPSRPDAKVTVRGQVAAPRTWTAETPHLYRLRIALEAGGRALHTVTERFGFRTIEVRPRDGVYLNGVRITLKGVNRHAFWPETGRSVSRAQSVADVRLMKEANLNAVRLSHYPPDEHFLEACDELGLYVLDELSGWQKPYGLAVGARLIGELVRRDVNHPSVLMWDNGNEGGWNEKNDVEFAKWDPQARPVLHPWAINSGINTDHYERYDSTVKLSAGPEIFMPTEFLHGLYDGGMGAGLRDYWDVMGRSRTVAGGFLWVWSDEGVVRTDQNGRIDTAGNQAPDGMTGPHREKEGSYFAVKEIWSPVQVTLPVDAAGELPATWDGTVGVENAYDFTSLERCRLDWQLLRFPFPATGGGPGRVVVAQGSVAAPPLAPRTSGRVALGLPKSLRQADALHVTARGQNGESLWTWSARIAQTVVSKRALAGRVPTVREVGDLLVVSGAAGDMQFFKGTNDVISWKRGASEAQFRGGPVLYAFTRRGRSYMPRTAEPQRAVSLTARTTGGEVVVEARYEGALRRIRWTFDRTDAVRMDYEFAFDGDVDVLGVGFATPGAGIVSKRWVGHGPYRAYRNRLEGTTFDLHEVAYNDPVPGQSFIYPEFKGYFRDWRWLELETDRGTLTVENASSIPFFGINCPRDGEPPMQQFPETGLAFLHVIPAIGNKFDTPDQLGPQSKTPTVSGPKRGSVILRLR